MINATFYYKHRIDKRKLFECLTASHISCKIPEKHASIIVRHNKASIFVFESGAINIIGVSTITQIVEAHKFIVRKLRFYGEKIILIPIKEFIKDNGNIVEEFLSTLR